MRVGRGQPSRLEAFKGRPHYKENKYLFTRISLLISLALIFSAPQTFAAVAGDEAEVVTLSFSTSEAINTFSDPIPACSDMYVTFSKYNTSTLSLYPVAPTDTTAVLIEANTRIRQFTVSETYGPFTPSKNFVRFVVDKEEENPGVSQVTVKCGPAGTQAKGLAFQPSPSVAGASNTSHAVISNPAVTHFGFGTAFATPDAFTADTYPGAADNGNEANNQAGFFYNLLGVASSTVSNTFETAFDAAWELAYRSTANTTDETWIEHNWDFVPPDFESTLSGSSGTFVANDVLTFSGGGTGRVVTVSGANPTQLLTFRQDFGTTAEGETVTNTSRAGAGTLGALTSVGSSRRFRPFLFVYRSLTQAAAFSFDTVYGDGVDTFNVSSGWVKHNNNVLLSGTGSAVYGPVVWGISDAASLDNGTYLCGQKGYTCSDVLEFSTPATPTDSACATEHLATVKFMAFCY